MHIHTMITAAQPVSVGELCAELERCGALDAFEADGIIIFTFRNRFVTVDAEPAAVTRAAQLLRHGGAAQ